MPTYVVESQPHIHIHGKGENGGGGAGGGRFKCGKLWDKAIVIATIQNSTLK
jgi:hypothetical protein